MSAASCNCAKFSSEYTAQSDDAAMTHELRALPKIDAHHHLWDLDHNDYPWLRAIGAPRMYGSYDAMRRNYLIDDFIADSAPHGVVKSVHVQANWNAADPVGETRWCQGVAERHGFPHAIVAYADLADPDAERVLAAHRESVNVRGIRQILGHTDDPRLERRDRPDHLSDPAWERGYGLNIYRKQLNFVKVGVAEPIIFVLSTSSNPPLAGGYAYVDELSYGPATDVEEISTTIPDEYNLSQNYPNPFNPSTKIEYSIPEASFVQLKVYDVLGNEVSTLVSEEQSAGSYRADFSGAGLSSGMYIAKLQAGNYTKTIKMTLLK